MAIYTPNAAENGSPPLANEQSDNQSPENQIIDNDVIDFRPLLNVIVNWWREILLLTIVAAVLGGALVFYISSSDVPQYEATAQVAIARIVSNVNLDDTFKTAMNSVGTSSQEGNARRSTLVGLVKNGTVANAVIEELGPILGPMSPSALSDNVEAGFVGDQVSDLIEITVTADDPKKAADIANSWAKNYVNQVNTLFGEMPTEMTDLVEIELDRARSNYDAAQSAYETSLSENDIPTLNRQIAEKQQLITTLQAGRQVGLQEIISQTIEYRQNVVSTYLNSIQQNRLLALTGEQDVNRALVRNLIYSIGESRQLAFTVEHESRVQLFMQYADLELQNRLLAIKQEQDAKTQIFQSYSDADLEAKLTIFNEQVDAKVGGLVESYAAQERVDQLLDQAIALQQQIEEGGEAGANSNSLPLLLLKIEAFAIKPPSDSVQVQNDPVQIDLTGSNGLELELDKQRTDIATLIETLRERSTMLAARIEEQSRALYNNEGYQLLEEVRPEHDALFAAIQEQYLALFQVDELAQSADSIATDSVLSQAIIAKYNDLFGLGSLATASMTISETTPVYTALVSQYPSLFQISDLTQLGDLLASDSALDSASQQQLIQLLQPPAGLENYLAAADVAAQPILNLEDEIRTLQATLEKKQSQLDRYEYARDLAEEAYDTLNSKRLELTLQRTAANREVRLAATANPPDAPVAGVSMMQAGAIFGVAGFIIAVLIALVAAYIDAQPFLSRLRLPQPSSASHASP